MMASSIAVVMELGRDDEGRNEWNLVQWVSHVQVEWRETGRFDWVRERRKSQSAGSVRGVVDQASRVDSRGEILW
jgi:hypothetical protein